jgi:hypothetical protein
MSAPRDFVNARRARYKPQPLRACRDGPPVKAFHPMSKIFVNEKPQGPALPPSAAAAGQAGGVAHVAANVLMILFGLAIAGGIALLLYHYWKVALAFLLAMVLLACWSYRAAVVAMMGAPGRAGGARAIGQGADGRRRRYDQAQRHDLSDLGHRGRGDKASPALTAGWPARRHQRRC